MGTETNPQYHARDVEDIANIFIKLLERKAIETPTIAEKTTFAKEIAQVRAEARQLILFILTRHDSKSTNQIESADGGSDKK